MMFSSRASIPIIFRSFIIAGSLLAEFVTAPNSADVLSEERAALQRGALTWPWDLTSTYIHPSHITKNPPGYEDAVRNSYTDLHLAAYGGKKEVIEGLIKPGTDIGVETKDHVKPGTETKDHVKPGTDIGVESKDHVKLGTDINAESKGHVKPGTETKDHVKPEADINARPKMEKLL
ncbi:hypothetical protein Ddc_15088 [Ditylenchus destructor]|nr:hypothetical protein Ddc_15088 [Ditylenchus destructor]